MSNDLIADISTNPNSISAFTGVNVSEGMQRALVNNGMRQFASMVKASFAANAGTITSASTLTLASISTGDYIFLTPSGGSSSISSFGTATAGLSKRLEALGTVILRNDSAKLNLPSGSDLTISTGDVIYARALSDTSWKVIHFPNNGIPQSIVNASSITASDTSSVLILSGGTVAKANASALSGSLPRNYISGLGLSNAADTAHDITVAVGEARDSTDAYDIILAAALTKQIDASWSVGDNAGGLFTGVVANSTWYHFFLIRRSDTGVVDAGFDTSITAANIPSGYDAYRRIGSVLTDGSANIRQFVERGTGTDREFWFVTPQLDIDDDNPGTAAVTRTLSTPLGVSTKALMNLGVYSTSGTNVAAYLSDLSTTDLAVQAVATTPAANPGATLGGGLATIYSWGGAQVWTNTSSQIRSRVSTSDATTRLSIVTLGWLDTL